MERSTASIAPRKLQMLHSFCTKYSCGIGHDAFCTA